MSIAADLTSADLTAPALAELARTIAAHPEEWVQEARFRTEGRWYARLRKDENHEVWLIGWLPGQATGFHDHGDSRGAFAVAFGSLEEHHVAVGGPESREVARGVDAGGSRSFGSGYIHDVRNASSAPALSVHAYSPPLSIMNTYDFSGGQLVQLATEQEADW
jgi:predicted metal-dependent enzyme (double-stranded beta helix superfamily)